MIKRVEKFTTHARDGMKPSQIISYYLFGFILIYRNVIKLVSYDSLFPEERSESPYLK